MSLSFELAPCSQAAAELVMCWRNDAETLRNSFDSKPKRWPEFYDEFATNYFIDKTLCPMFALYDGERCAFVRFRRIPHWCEQTDGVCDISIMIAPEWRGRGLAGQILKDVQPILASWNISTVVAEIKPDNVASVKSFEKAGFVFFDEHQHKNEKSGDVMPVLRYVVRPSMGFGLANCKAMLLDLDGTIADSLPVLKKTYFQFMKDHNLEGTDEEFQQLTGPSLKEVVGILKDRYRIQSPEDALYQHYENLLADKYASEVEQIPGSDNLIRLAYLKGLKLVLVTSATKRLATEFLGRHGWQSMFHAVVTCESVKQAKPNPEIYLRALTELQLQKEQVIAIEDSLNGIKSGVAAGISVYAVRQPQSAVTTEHMFQAGALRVFSGLTDIAECFFEGAGDGN